MSNQDCKEQTMSRWGFAPYVPVAQRRAMARREMEKLRKKGNNICPVEIKGRTIARSFWGKGWCEHLESFSDFANRLPRGRTYARNGSVCHLELKPGIIKAYVSGSELYNVSIKIKKLNKTKWQSIKKECSGRIGSMLELLQGKLSEEVMTIVSHKKKGLFPLPEEISLDCSCPDWAIMCKHVAAVLYGVGNRLDLEPDLLFQLRGVDAAELIAAEMSLPVPDSSTGGLDEESLGDIFGIDLDDSPSPQTAANQSTPRKKAPVPKNAGGKNQKKNPGPSAESVSRKKPAAKKQSRKKKSPEKFSPTGDNIRQLRQQCGLSAAKFAARIGVSAASVYRWEKTQGTCSILESYLNALEKLHNSLADKK